jgi:hypothetical protein
MADEKQDENSGCPLEGQDIVTPGPPLPNGGRLCIHHSADHTLSLGEMHPLEHGKPIPEDANLIRNDNGVLRVGPSIREMKAAGNGPAQVATQEYRDSWERTFGKPHVGQA